MSSNTTTRICANGDAPGGAGRAGPVRAGRAASGVRPRAAARVDPRGRDLVPRRARRDADALPARLAHHRDLRDFRRRRRPAPACSGSTRGTRPGRSAMPRRNPPSLVESLGSMSKSLGVGNAAKNGLAAALFAEGGFTGPPSRPIEGRYGFAPVTSDSADLARDDRRARRALGNARQRLQALSVRGRAVPGHRRLSRIARPSRAGAGAHRRASSCAAIR